MWTPVAGILVFQSVANMRRCLQHSTFQLGDTAIGGIGDWYFTGEYPTPGGYRVLHTALANYLSCSNDRSY